jgi:tetratricopeptide (TPR) repeat protein
VSAKQNKSVSSQQLMKKFSVGPILGAVFIFLLTLLVYVPALRGGFLWDDDTLLTENRLIKAQDGLSRLWWSTEAWDYYPVTWTSFWLEWRLWGLNPTGYHVTNILLHALGAALIWQALKQLRVPGAWLAALVFAVHPVCVESVAWISERKNTLSIVFYALAFLLFLKSEGSTRRGCYWFSVAAFLLGLLSKSSGVMLPFALLLCAWWQRGRIERKDLLRSIPFFVLAAVLGAVTVWFQHNQQAGQPAAIQGEMFLQLAADNERRSLLLRLNAAGHVFWFYLFKVLAPVNLMTVYPLWRLDTSSPLSYVPTLSVVAMLLVFWRYRRTWGRPALFGLGYFAITLLPVLGFLNMPYIGRSPVVTDHLQYLAMIGIIGLVTAATASAYNARPGLNRQITGAVVAALVALLCFLSWQRAQVYQDALAFWTDAVSKNPDAAKAHFNFGAALHKRGQIDLAMDHYSQALQVKPNYAGAHNNLGNILANRGQIDEAIVHYAAALRREPQFAEAHYNWGNALASRGQLDEALAHYAESLRLNPDSAELHYNWGVTLIRKGQSADAVAHLTEAVRLKPTYPEAHFNLGLLLAEQGRIDEAFAQFTDALRARPDYAEAHNDLGNALLKQGRFDEALAQYSAAVRDKPDYAEAHYNWGLALARRGRIQEAIAQFTEAVRLNPRDAQAQNNLGVALANQGRINDAAAHFAEAVRLKPDDPDYQRNLQQTRPSGLP